MVHADLSDTIAALATPPGVGAIAVIRLSGPDAFALADSVFRGKKLAKQPSHTAHFGRVADENGNTLDEVLATVFRAPHSYTGDDTVEISCHGSPFIQQALLELLLRRGARLARPGEYTLRAFLHGKMDLSQAEAVADLVASEDAAAHAVALQHLRGGFRDAIAQLRERLVHFASLVELELDFGEEDVQFADRRELRALVREIRIYLEELIHSFALGNALRHGVTTVIAGRPNAGKSTLLNALLQEERAIVSDMPGTTRDTVEEVLNIQGVRFRLVDTAGIREAQDQIEHLGVQRTFEKVRQAAILCYVWDVSAMTLAEVYHDLRQLLGDRKRSTDTTGPKLLVVCNKMDRNPYFQADWLLDPATFGIHPYLLEAKASGLPMKVFPLHPDELVPLSAKNGQNIHYLQEKLFDTVSGGHVRPDGQIVTNARHHEALQRADHALADVLRGLDAGTTGDFVAQDIRRALYALGEISGEIGVEELLGNIFSRFCIGK